MSQLQDLDVNDGIQARFIGAWRLVWLEEQGADGTIHRSDCTGLLVYTPDGRVSLQVMYCNPPANPREATNQYAHSGCEAPFGTYQVDERAHTFTFHVQGALVRPFVGKELQRAFEFSGNQLFVKSTNPNEHWRVAFERYY